MYLEKIGPLLNSQKFNEAYRILKDLIKNRDDDSSLLEMLILKYKIESQLSLCSRSSTEQIVELYFEKEMFLDLIKIYEDQNYILSVDILKLVLKSYFRLGEIQKGKDFSCRVVRYLLDEKSYISAQSFLEVPDNSILTELSTLVEKQKSLATGDINRIQSLLNTPLKEEMLILLSGGLHRDEFTNSTELLKQMIFYLDEYNFKKKVLRAIVSCPDNTNLILYTVDFFVKDKKKQLCEKLISHCRRLKLTSEEEKRLEGLEKKITKMKNFNYEKHLFSNASLPDQSLTSEKKYDEIINPSDLNFLLKGHKIGRSTDEVSFSKEIEYMDEDDIEEKFHDLVISFLMMGMPLLAIQIIEKVGEGKSTDEKIKRRYLYAQSYFLNEDYYHVINICESFINETEVKSNEKCDFLYLAAESYRKINEKSKAEELYKQVYSISPNYRMVKQRLNETR